LTWERRKMGEDGEGEEGGGGNFFVETGYGFRMLHDEEESKLKVLRGKEQSCVSDHT
jgi:hypothetical protein